MIRPFTCICMLLAGASGLYLYQSKHRAQMLDREITRTLKLTDAARDRIGTLRAEWALLNEPERLADLASRHLALRTLQPGQFVQVADLASRLPPPAAPGTVYAPMDEPAAAPPQPLAAAPVAVAAVAPKPAMPRPPAPLSAPVQLAAAKPVRPHDAALAPDSPRPAASMAPIVTAVAAPMHAPVPSGAPALMRVGASAPADGMSIGASVLAHMQAAQGRQSFASASYTPAPAAPAPIYQAPAYQSPVYAAPAYSAPAITSALGTGRAALPPPVPVSR